MKNDATNFEGLDSNNLRKAEVGNIDRYTKWIANFFISKTVLLIAMVLFLCGLIVHIQGVFNNWWLSISAQFIILLMTVNAAYLPRIKTEYGIDVPIFNFLVAIFVGFFLYVDIDAKNPAELLTYQWFINLAQAIFFAALELIFAYLFTARVTKQEVQQYDTKLESIDKSAIEKVPEQTFKDNAEGFNFLTVE